MCKSETMRISPPRKELHKQNIRSMLIARPRMTNVEIANKIGLHRNTVARYVEEVRIESEKAMRESWTLLLDDLIRVASMRKMQLEELWLDSYSSSYTRPAQQVRVIDEYWKIQKELYRFQLEYLGFAPRQNNTLVQINFPKV